jgi:hypothetical protein
VDEYRDLQWNWPISAAGGEFVRRLPASPAAILIGAIVILPAAIFLFIPAICVLLAIIVSLAVAAQNGKLVSQRITPAEFPWSKSVNNQEGSAMRPRDHFRGR